MKTTEAIHVVKKLTVYQPTWKPTADDIEEWADALLPHDHDDALAAVRKLGRTPRPAGAAWDIGLREILTELAATKARRWEERRHLYVPPSGLTAEQYRRWELDARTQATRRDWTPVDALQPGAGTKAIGALLAQLTRGTVA